MRVSENHSISTIDARAIALSMSERLATEQRVLLNNLESLRKMIASPAPEISRKHLALLKKQEKAMSLYNKILFARINDLVCKRNK
jgi:hypothetical protein